MKTELYLQVERDRLPQFYRRVAESEEDLTAFAFDRNGSAGTDVWLVHADFDTLNSPVTQLLVVLHTMSAARVRYIGQYADIGRRLSAGTAVVGTILADNKWEADYFDVDDGWLSSTEPAPIVQAIAGQMSWIIDRIEPPLPVYEGRHVMETRMLAYIHQKGAIDIRDDSDREQMLTIIAEWVAAQTSDTWDQRVAVFGPFPTVRINAVELAQSGAAPVVSKMHPFLQLAHFHDVAGMTVFVDDMLRVYSGAPSFWAMWGTLHSMSLFLADAQSMYLYRVGFSGESPKLQRHRSEDQDVIDLNLVRRWQEAHGQEEWE